MKKTMALTLTLTDVALLRDILSFIEARGVDGAPLAGHKHQQTTSRLKTLRRLRDQADGAYAHFFAPPVRDRGESI